MPAKLRMNRERILEELRKAGSFLGSSGVDRKNLFVRPSEGNPVKGHILPDLKPRGRSGELFPFLATVTHWVTQNRKDGTAFQGGLTCYRHLKEEEPHAYEFLCNEKLIDPKRDHDCVPCLILDMFADDEDALPHGKFGITFAGRKAFHFQIVLDKNDYDKSDNQKIKILPSGATGKQSFMEQLCDPDFLEDGLFEDNGVYTTWRALGKSWQVTMDPRRQCWLEGWKESMLTLELAVPRIMPWNEQVSTMIANLPQHAVELEKTLINGSAPSREAKPKKEVAKPSTPTKAKSRIKKAK